MEKVLTLNNIEKKFGHVHALKGITFDIYRGETLALVGENGAGKSTLVKILTGAYSKDKGQILYKGKEMSIQNPMDAKKIGIGQVYQRSEIVPKLTVAENILLGETGFTKHGMVEWKPLFEKAQTLLDTYEIPVSGKSVMENLGVAACQLVSIVKVLQRNPEIIIFDEPTAVLSDKEVEILFKIISKIQSTDTSIVYISHRLEEIYKVSNRIAIMRDGELVTILDNENVTNDDVITHMLGRKLSTMFPEKTELMEKEVVMKVENLSSDKVKDISFELNKGEILGIAGLVGSGRTELMRALYGMDMIKQGQVLLGGKAVAIRTPRDVISKGVFLAPEDRKGEGLVLTRSIKENMTYSLLKKFIAFGFIKNKTEKKHAQHIKEAINIKAPNIDYLSGNLSGENQQKVVIAKALTAQPKILIADEPTQGIDVGAKAEIYTLLNNLAKDGMSVIIVSSEMEEVMRLCHRLLVMRHGRLVGEVSGEKMSDSKHILNLMYRS